MNSKKIIYWGNICPSFFIFSSTSSNNVIIPITVTLTYDENGNYVTRKDECRNEQCKLKISSGVVGTTILKIFKSKQYFRCKYIGAFLDFCSITLLYVWDLYQQSCIAKCQTHYYLNLFFRRVDNVSHRLL